MNNIILLLILAFSIPSLSMEASSLEDPIASYVERNPQSEIELIKGVLVQLSESKDLDILGFAQMLGAVHVKVLNDRMAELHQAQKQCPISASVLKDIYSALKLSKETEGQVETLRDSIRNTSRGPIKTLNLNKLKKFEEEQMIDPLIKALEAELTAWTIINNSIDVAKNEQHDVFTIVPEVLRMVVTSNVNYNGNGDKTKDYWLPSVNISVGVLAILLAEADARQTADAAKHVLVSHAYGMGKPGWYLAEFLTDINKALLHADDESPLKLSAEAIAYFSDLSQQSHVSISGETKIALSKTELFKILDVKERAKFGADNFRWLKNYHFFLGGIDEYVAQQKKKVEAELLRTDKPSRKNKNNPSPLRKTKKGNEIAKNSRGKKSPSLTSKQPPLPKGKNGKEFKQTLSEKDCASLTSKQPPLPKKRNGKGFLQTLSEKDCASLTTEDSGGTWQQVSSRRPKKNRPDKEQPALVSLKNGRKGIFDARSLTKLTYEELGEMSRSKRVHFMDYRHLMSIWSSDTLNYEFKGEIYDTEIEFTQLARNLAAVGKKAGDYNVLSYFITFHGISDQQEPFSETFWADGLYVNRPGVCEHLTTEESFLSAADRRTFESMRPLETLWMKNFMSEKSRSVVDGVWLHNSLHTEPMMVLDLFNSELVKYLRAIHEKRGEFNLTCVVIGIDSKFDICFRCQRLLQGFQWNLQSILKQKISANKDLSPHIIIDDDFATAIIAKTHVSIKNPDDRNHQHRAVGATTLNQQILPVAGGGNYSNYPRHQLILNEQHH